MPRDQQEIDLDHDGADGHENEDPPKAEHDYEGATEIYIRYSTVLNW